MRRHAITMAKVAHRTGGLERLRVPPYFQSIVAHRTGGLENNGITNHPAVPVAHRTGGLENERLGWQ